jgi:hypothetical protein
MTRVLKQEKTTVNSEIIEDVKRFTKSSKVTTKVCTGDEFYMLLSNETRILKNKALETLQLSHIQDFYDAILNINSLYDNYELDRYLNSFRQCYELYDMRSVESRLVAFDSLLESLRN